MFNEFASMHIWIIFSERAKAILLHETFPQCEVIRAGQTQETERLVAAGEKRFEGEEAGEQHSLDVHHEGGAIKSDIQFLKYFGDITKTANKYHCRI